MTGAWSKTRAKPTAIMLMLLGLFLRLALAKLPAIHKRNSIFFVHTSAEEKISDVARCSIESAARKILIGELSYIRTVGLCIRHR